MDVDEVFEKIGEFGTAQKKIIFLSNLFAHGFLGFQTLLIGFIGRDPGWSCIEPQEDTLRVLFGPEDPLACEMVEKGACAGPNFKYDSTSIVAEVRAKKGNYKRQRNISFL